MNDESKADANPLTKAFLEGRDAGLEWAARIILEAVPPHTFDREAEHRAETCLDLSAKIRSRIGNITELFRPPRLDEVESYIVTRRMLAALEGRDLTPYETILNFVRDARTPRGPGTTPTRVGVPDEPTCRVERAVHAGCDLKVQEIEPGGRWLVTVVTLSTMHEDEVTRTEVIPTVDRLLRLALHSD